MLLSSILQLKKTLKGLAIDAPAEFKKSYTMMALIYQNLAKKLPKEEAFEIMRAVVLPLGLATMQANFRAVEADRNYENLVKYQRKAKDEGATKLNRMVIRSEDGNEYRYCVTRCMFYEIFKELGVPELTSIMCSIDNAIFSSYLPNEIRFERSNGHTLYEGAAECEFRIYKVEKN